MAQLSRAIVICWTLLACSSGTEPARVGLDRLELRLVPDIATLLINETARAYVSGFDASGSPYPAGPVAWRSTNPGVIEVDDEGLVEGRAPGTTKLIATVGQLADTVDLEVAGTLHDQAIVIDERWTATGSPHIVRGRLTAGAGQGAILTIESGAELVFENDAGLTFGVTGAAALVAAGTAAAPITMRGASATPTPGSWIGLTFRGATQSELRHVTMSGCGGARPDDQPRACVVLGERFPGAEPTLLVQNVTVLDASSAAMILQWKSRFAAGSAALSVQNLQGHVATVPAAAAAGFPVGGSFSGNGVNELRLTEDTIRESATWTPAGLTWSVQGRVYVESAQGSAPLLTLAPGSSFRFTSGGGIVVGESGSGALHVGAVGGATVNLTAADAFGWKGIVFLANAGASTIANASLEDCGNGSGSGFGDGCVSVIGSFFGTAPAPVLQNVSIRRALSTGIMLVGGGRFGDGSANVTITETSGSPGTPLTVSLGSSPASIPTGTYLGNALDAIWMFAGEVTSTETWRAHGIPYMMRQGLGVGHVTNPVLTIEAGVELRFSPGGLISVGAVTPGALRAIGTANAPVLFTSEFSHSGSWIGVDVGAHALAATLLDRVVVDYAGIQIARDLGPIVRNTLVRGSDGCGITRMSGTPWTTDFTVVELGNTFQGNAGPNQCGP